MDVVFVPGVSGWDQRFARLQEEFGNDFRVFKRWDGPRDLMLETIDRLHSDLRAFLEGPTCLVAKSFGGGLALAYRDPRIKGMVLMAPAIGVSEEGNLPEWRDRKLLWLTGTFQKIEVGHEALRNTHIPVLMFQGTRDTVVMPAVTRRLAELLPNCRLVEVEAGHSYRSPEVRERMCGEIAGFVHGLAAT